VTAGKIPADAVGSSEIAANAVGSSELADNAVDTAAIANDAVTNAKIADDAIEAAQLDNNSVTAAAIAADAVGTSEIADQAVTLDKLPHGDGSSDGKFLRSNNGADPTFETVSIPAGTTINNNADNKVITGSGTANTLNAEGNVYIDAQGDLGLGISDITPTAASYNGATLQLHQTTSGSYGSQIKMTTASGGYGANDGFYLAHWGGNNGTFIYNKENAPLYFGTNGTERATIDEHLTITDGNLVIGTSGHGIDFSATANASSSESTTTMANELFDDYEVGSWQPTWKPASGSIGHISRHGDYVKIGRTVHCMFAISANGSTNESGELQVSGLPFTATIPNANGTRGGGGVLFAGYHMNSDVTKCVANGTTLYLLLSDNSRLQTNSSGMGYGYNAAQLSGMFSYITAS